MSSLENKTEIVFYSSGYTFLLNYTWNREVSLIIPVIQYQNMAGYQELLQNYYMLAHSISCIDSMAE